MKKILYITLLLVVFTSCNDYLDIEPKGVRIPNSIEDYDLLLAPVVKINIENEVFLSADDFKSTPDDLGDLADKDNIKVQLYTFSDSRFGNPETPALSWNTSYSYIYVFNKVINEIDDANESMGYSEKDKNRIKAEALYGRAGQYFFLVNIFAKHYDKSSAGSEKAVPIVKEANTSGNSPTISTVAEVYDLIINDLNQAIPNLPTMGVEFNRPTKGSGYALLARIYLYQANYEMALKNAQLALNENDQLSDYTAMKSPLELEGLYNAEQYSQLFYGYIMGHYYGILKQEIVDLYDKANDIRFSTMLGCTWVNDPVTGWYQDCSKVKIGFKITPNPMPTIAEMYLTVAECYARSSAKSEAINKINELRKKRIIGIADVTESDFASDGDVLKFVLEERRRELLMSGTRLFDLKRLNLDAKFAKTTIHELNGTTYEAAPNSGKLVLPIPAHVKKLNTNL